MELIPFNKPFLTGNETDYIADAVNSGKISGNGIYTKKCQHFFETNYGFKKALLTTSCTDALEMAAILANIQSEDEVIIPSYTFVSTALAFIRQGAKIIFADSYDYHPNIDADKIESLITNKTKAIVPVHYAGVACDMDKIMHLAKKYDLIVIEDAAQAIDSFYTNSEGVKKPLGSIGHLATFSFHETKNIISGEGGLLAVNDERFINRSEIIWEKGTNRSSFFRGEVDKYGWIDTGSSFLPSEITAAFLWAQLENLDKIQNKRKLLFNRYQKNLKNIKEIQIPHIPKYAYNNGHMFYLILNNVEQRQALIQYLKDNGVHAVFHYLSLHKSPYYKDKYKGDLLQNSDMFTNQLVRLPFYYNLEIAAVDRITKLIKDFFNE